MPDRVDSTQFVPTSNSLDFLRLVLAISVIVAHSFALSGLGSDPLSRATHGQENLGGLAIAGFFIISGYLITQSYRRSTTVWRFLWHRFLRIYPAFWVCLVTTVVVFAPAMYLLTYGTVSGYPYRCNESIANYLVANFAIKIEQHGICGLLAHNPFPGAVNGSLWTLYDEVRCYLAIATIGVMGGLGGRKWALVVSTTILYVVYGVSVIFPESHALPLMGGQFLRNGAFFFAGCLFNLYSPRIPVRTALALACLMLVIMSSLIDGAYALTSVIALPYFVLWLATKLPLRNWGKYGDYSYGLYIFAFPVQQILALANTQQSGVIVFIGQSVAYTFIFAFLSCHLVERPALKLKRLTLSRRPRSENNTERQ